MKPGDIAIFLTTAPDEDVAVQLARGLVSSGIAACVNLLPSVRSFYPWEGEVQDDAEVQLVIKSRAIFEDALTAWIQAHHPYDEPELLMIPVTGGSASYLEWVRASTEDPRG